MTEGNADALGTGIERLQIADERGVGRDQVGCSGAGGLAVAAIVVLREKRDVVFCRVLAEGNGPRGFAAGVGRAGAERRDGGSLGNDRGAELGPERLKGGEIPRSAGEIGAAIEIAFVADLETEKRRAEGLVDVGNFFGCKRGRGSSHDGTAGVGDRACAAEIDAVKALPARGFNEGGKCVHVAGCDLACGLPSARRGPDVAVHGIAADAQDAGAEKLEQSNQIRVCAGKEVGILIKGAFLVGKPGEGGADRAGGCCSDGERGSSEGAGRGGLSARRPAAVSARTTCPACRAGRPSRSAAWQE